MIKETVMTGLSLAAKVPDLLRATRSGSLIDYTQPARVEPVVLLDDKLVNLPHISDVLQSTCSLFSGYYLQAVALSVNVGAVDVIKLLDKLNPNRSLDDNIVQGAINAGMRMSMESEAAYQFQLPVPGQPIGLEHFGLEANLYEAIAQAKASKKDAASGGDNETTKPDVAEVKKEAIELAREASNLSVGKLLDVHITSNGQSASFPISVRLITTVAPPSGIVHTLSVGSVNTGAAERYHLWRAGQLEFWRDLVMTQDLIDAHKDALLKDSSGVYASALKRNKRNKLSAILSGNPSVATASNIVIMDQTTQKDLERKIGGRMKDYATRQKVFKKTYSMLIITVDQDWDTVTFYHRGVDMPTELSVRELQSSNRNKGPDVGEILKAYQLGASPSL